MTKVVKKSLTRVVKKLWTWGGGEEVVDEADEEETVDEGVEETVDEVGKEDKK